MSLREELNELARKSYEISKSKGFNDTDVAPEENYELYILQATNRLMLVVGEVIEAHEEIRAGRDVTEQYYSIDKDGLDKPEGVPAELADVIIRLAHFAGTYGIDLGAAIETKQKYNAQRSRMNGGKKF